MTDDQKTSIQRDARYSFDAKALGDTPIPEDVLAYYRARFRDQLHEIVLQEFLDQNTAGTLTKAILARRLGKRPEQVNRWLGTPTNCTVDTVSDLLLAISGSYPDVTAKRINSNWARKRMRGCY